MILENVEANILLQNILECPVPAKPTPTSKNPPKLTPKEPGVINIGGDAL